MGSGWLGVLSNVQGWEGGSFARTRARRNDRMGDGRGSGTELAIECSAASSPVDLLLLLASGSRALPRLSSRTLHLHCDGEEDEDDERSYVLQQLAVTRCSSCFVQCFVYDMLIAESATPFSCSPHA